MRGDLADRYAETIVGHRKLVVLVLLLVTLAIAAGAVVGDSEEGGIGQFDVDSEETRALEEIEERYATDDTVVAQIVVRDEGGDVLTRESLLDSLRLQEEVQANESINETLTDEGFVGLENVVATGAVFEDHAAESEGPPDTSQPTLDEQIEAIDSRSEEEVEALLVDVLDPDADVQGDPYEFLPADYDPGSTDADARITFVFQENDGGSDDDPQLAYAAQIEIDSLVSDRFEDAFVFGQGITDAASSSAVGDSFAIITPVAFVLVLSILAITYRDVADVLLAFVGIALVLAWLAGIQGWLEVPSSQLLIAVPFLLIGLAIDYSLHVVMRYREARRGLLKGRSGGEGGEVGSEGETGDSERIGAARGMALGLGGVTLALAAATFSTAVGFLSNYVSPLPAIQDFAVLSAGGILATFVVFGAFVPALKVEIDSVLEGRFGRDRAKPPFGVGSGLVGRALSAVVAGVRRAPLAVVFVAFLLAAGGAYGATGIDTEFNQADFLPEDAPEWTKSLPGPLAPDTYTISDDAEYLGDNFRERGEGSRSQVLIRGDVTDPATLVAIDEATASAEGETISLRAYGAPAIESPASVVWEIAGENESVAAAVGERDTDGDGLPDEDVAGLYDVLYDADADRAATVIGRTDDGGYDSARLLVSVRGDAAAQAVAEDTRSLATAIESDAPVSATAAGGPVTTAVIQDALLETLVQAFAVTLVVILVFLTVLYWARHGALSLGAITLAPVVAALAWLLGAMALLDLPFNSETAVITSLAIGLGVDYSIHVGERFVDERRGSDGTSERRAATDGSREPREDRGSLEEALAATITGTGGALLGSALTTAAGFGVLALALAPPLRRFGFVTGLSIVFAFVACLTVLPCLLVVRERVLVRMGSGE